MIVPKFYGAVKNGKIEHQTPELFQNYIIFNFKDGQEVEITVKKKFKKRTSGQPGEETNFNGYYWAVVVRLIADEIGEIDQDIVHGWIQVATGNWKQMKDGNRIAKGTGGMTGGEFADYCSRARIWAGTPWNICEAGLFIPQPHEVEYP